MCHWCSGNNEKLVFYCFLRSPKRFLCGEAEAAARGVGTCCCIERCLSGIPVLGGLRSDTQMADDDYDVDVILEDVVTDIQAE